MKTLGKLNINSERIIKDDELVTLQGGYGTCYGCYGEYGLLGTFYGCGFTEAEAFSICSSMYSGTIAAIQGNCN